MLNDEVEYLYLFAGVFDETEDNMNNSQERRANTSTYQCNETETNST